MKPGTLRAWFQVHKWTSLVSVLFLLMLCITGLPLIFHHEIDHALGYSVEPPELPGVERRASIDAMIADAHTRNPGDAMQFLVGDPDEPVWFIRLGESVNGAITAFDTYDARTGDLLNVYPLGQGFMEVIVRLHVDLFAGLPGMLFLGFMGLLLVLSLVSGAVLYGPFMGKVSFGTVRRERSARLKWLDMHNAVGIVTLVWVLVVGATGAIHTLGGPIFGKWQAEGLTELTRSATGARPSTSLASGPASGVAVVPSTRVSIDRVVSAASDAVPEHAVSFMAFPGNAFAGPQHFVAYVQGTAGLDRYLLRAVAVDAGSGRVTGVRPMPWYVNLLMLSQPLHFGDYGGMPLKVLWAALDVLAMVVLISGLVLWIKRRKLGFESWLRTAAGASVGAT